MKNLLFLFLFPYSFMLFGQTDSLLKNDILPRLTGTYDSLSPTMNAYYVLGDYRITTEWQAGALTPKKVKQLKKQYHLKKVVKEFSEPNNWVVETVDDKKIYTIHHRYYFKQVSKGKINIVGFSSGGYQDTTEEHAFLALYRSDKIPKKLITNIRNTQIVNFLGRSITLPPNSCVYQYTNNFQCEYRGQMNWAAHKDMKTAEKSIALELESSKMNKMATIKSDKMIPVLFEGKEVNARKVVFDIKLPRIVIGNAQELIVYYVATEVRSLHVSCVMSHYDNDNILKEKGLPPLISEVMQLR